MFASMAVGSWMIQFLPINLLICQFTLIFKYSKIGFFECKICYPCYAFNNVMYMWYNILLTRERTIFIDIKTKTSVVSRLPYDSNIILDLNIW